MITLAVGLKALFLALMVWASLRHFKRQEAEPKGATLLSIATISGTALNAWLALSGSVPASGLAWVAAVMSALALAGFVAALRETSRSALSLAFSERTPGSVVDTGIYGVIRHPFYAAYLLYWTSWFVLTGFHFASGLVLVGMAITYELAARKEERLLTARLGNDYRQLVERTRRFVPGIY